MPRAIHLSSVLPSRWVAARKGQYLDDNDYSILLQRDPADVYKPDGSVLLRYRPAALSLNVCERALVGLRQVPARPNDHRDYIVSNAIGYFVDRRPCRKTAFTAKRLGAWPDCQPFIYECDAVFARHYQERHQAQLKVARSTDPDFVIGQTAFTTVTVNLWDATHDARTRVHKDAGDLPEGFGVISVISTGNYQGGYLVFPAYRVAVDLRTTDVLLCDVHAYHGNTDIVGQPGWERIATVHYYRTQMQQCKRKENPG